MKTITSSFYTTTNFHSFVDVFKYFFKFRKENYIVQAEQKLLNYIFDNKKTESTICSFYNARSALFHGLQLLGIGEGDEVLIQAYTCVSVSNSIIHTGAKPVYVDIDDSLNMDPELISKQITPKTKAIMVQHNFGNPVNLDKIQEICQKNNLLLIEDCAHSLGAKYKGKKVGQFGDISFFSFGRDKVLSTVNGGFLIVNNPQLAEGTEIIKHKLQNPPKSLVRKNLIYLIISFLSYKLYDFFKIGKIIIFLSKKLKIIPEILSSQEKQCHDKTFFYNYPNALAYIALGELDRVDSYNRQRQKFASEYEKLLKVKEIKFVESNPDAENIFLRFTIFPTNSKEINQQAKSQKILLGNRYQQVIAPENVNYNNAMYLEGSCPNAEKLASQTLNLPCHPNLKQKDLERVLNFVKTM